jgi:membrane protein DedA with SNARE-associated domain
MKDLTEACMAEGGYLAIALLMFLENIFPPIPSEVIMPLAGVAAANGHLSLAGVILAGSLGSLAGAWAWYGVGRWIGTEGLKAWSGRHGRWLTLTPRDVETADRWFDRHGTIAVLVGRLIPTVRTLISVPAGMSEMPQGRFLVFSAIGTVAWTALLALLGNWLGAAPEAIQAWIDPLSFAVLGIAAAVYIYRVVTFRPKATDRGGRDAPPR